MRPEGEQQDQVDEVRPEREQQGQADERQVRNKARRPLYQDRCCTFEAPSNAALTVSMMSPFLRAQRSSRLSSDVLKKSATFLSMSLCSTGSTLRAFIRHHALCLLRSAKMQVAADIMDICGVTLEPTCVTSRMMLSLPYARCQQNAQ